MDKKANYPGFGIITVISLIFIAFAIYTYFKQPRRFSFAATLAVVIVVINMVAMFISMRIRRRIHNVRLGARTKMDKTFITFGFIFIIVFLILYVLIESYILLGLLAMSVAFTIYKAVQMKLRR